MGLRNLQHLTLPVAGELDHIHQPAELLCFIEAIHSFSLILVFISCGLLNQRAGFETIQCCFLQELTHLSELEIQAMPGLT